MRYVGGDEFGCGNNLVEVVCCTCKLIFSRGTIFMQLNFFYQFNFFNVLVQGHAHVPSVHCFIFPRGIYLY